MKKFRLKYRNPCGILLDEVTTKFPKATKKRKKTIPVGSFVVCPVWDMIQFDTGAVRKVLGICV